MLQSDYRGSADMSQDAELIRIGCEEEKVVRRGRGSTAWVKSSLRDFLASLCKPSNLDRAPTPAIRAVSKLTDASTRPFRLRGRHAQLIVSAAFRSAIERKLS
jgi:hypothetical protein